MKHGLHPRMGSELGMLLVLIVLSAGIMALDRSGPDNAVAGQISRLFTPFENLSSTIMNLTYVRKENMLLRMRLMEEARENQILRAQVHDDARLRNLLGFEAAYPGTLCACRVIRELGQRMGGGIILDKGTSSGIERNMTVISTEGLVGRVIKPARYSCLVKRIVDPGYRVSAREQRTRAGGILSTLATGRTVMDWVSPDARIGQGDTVVTSGLGSVTPGGIPLGNVAAIKEEPKQFSLSLDVEPFVDFDRLEEVFVILRPPPDYGALVDEDHG